MTCTPPAVVKLSRFGGADCSNASARNAAHVVYEATHGAELGQGQNAAHVIYEATHGARAGEGGRCLIGNAAEAGVEAARQEALAHEGHQWRWVVSLRGDDAKRLGFDSANTWHRVAYEIAPRLAAVIGMPPGSLRWVAAAHDPDPRLGGWKHPHIHLALWCNDPTFRRPHKLTRDEIRGARRAIVQAIHGPERIRLSRQRTALREAIRRSGAQTIRSALAVARTLRGRLPAAPDLERHLRSRLEALAGVMPSRGRAALAYMPPEVKREARAIADWLLSEPPLAERVAQYRATAREQAALYTEDCKKLDAAEARAYGDLRDRVAQSVVRAAARLRPERQAAVAPGRREARALAITRGVLITASVLLREVLRDERREARPEHERRRRADGRGRDF